MFNNKKMIALFLFVGLINTDASYASGIEDLQLIQVLKDDVNDFDGLGNPRSVKVISDNSKVFCF